MTCPSECRWCCVIVGSIVMQLVIPSISCFQATVCVLTLDFSNVKQCGEVDRLIDGSLGVDMDIFL